MNGKTVYITPPPPAKIMPPPKISAGMITHT